MAEQALGWTPPPRPGLDMHSTLLLVPQTRSCFAVCYLCCSQRDPVKNKTCQLLVPQPRFSFSSSENKPRGLEAAGSCSTLSLLARIFPPLGLCTAVPSPGVLFPGGWRGSLLAAIRAVRGPPPEGLLTAPSSNPHLVCNGGWMPSPGRFIPLCVVCLPTPEGRFPGSRSCPCVMHAGSPGLGTVLGHSRAEWIPWQQDGAWCDLEEGGGGQVLDTGLLSLEWPVWNRPDQWTCPRESWCHWLLFPAQEEQP